MRHIEKRNLVSFVSSAAYFLKLAVEYNCSQLPSMGYSVAAKHKLCDSALKGTRKVTSLLTN